MDHGPLNEQEPHLTSVGPGHQTVAEGDQGAQYHEKKSVFTKVKAKAKKVKDTLTGHGHGHDEEDDEDDQEKFEDPQIHDSPKYDPAASRTTAEQVDVDPLEPNVNGSNFHGQEGTKRQQRVTGSHDHRTKDNVPSSTDVPSSTVKGDLPHGPPFDPPGIFYGRDNVPVKGDVLDPPGIHHHSNRENVPSTRTSVAICDDNVVVHPGIHHNSRDDVPSRTTPQQDHSGQTKVNLERPKGPEEDFAAPKDSSGDYTSSNHQTKVTDPTGNGDEAAGVTSILQSFEKMKVKDGSEGMGKTGQEHNLPAADKVVSAKNVVGDKDNTTGVYDHEGVGGRPSSDQSGYTEKLSYATSAIADRAISAKNVVALKLGYGEKDNEVPGTGTYSTANQQQQQHGVEGNNHEKGGGGSLKGYLAEKLKPGEEDKALSEVITESLHKRKPEQQQKQEAAPRPEGEVISDAMHKRNDDPDGEVNSRAMGKVTESEEVARRLGDTKDDQALGNKGMVEKIKGAVGSWLGTGDQSPGSQRSKPSPASDDTGHTSN